jgi:hypothetical protein
MWWSADRREVELAKCRVLCYEHHRLTSASLVVPAGRPASRTVGAKLRGAVVLVPVPVAVGPGECAVLDLRELCEVFGQSLAE